ncbi:DUF3854 domain-containing protein [Microcoleus vaginatus GB2-A3]|uniref:plasmid replication protein, CyRepA1 family n=1 Tax=Microcoleus vaginatus TaxID=119532 RepID=UPI0032ABE96E
MTTIVDYTEPFSQEDSSTGLDRFDQDYADKLVYKHLVEGSGIHPDIARLNCPTAIGEDYYDGLYRDTDKTTNSGGGIEAARNLARCMGDAGYHLGNTFYLPTDLNGDTKVAKFGIIKSKGIYRPAGMPAIGFRTLNGRFRQLAGAPIALNIKKESKGFGKTTTKVEARRYHQPIGKPLELLFARIIPPIWEEIAAKAGLPMPTDIEVDEEGAALGFWEWVRANNCPIFITEGEKKALALISRGYAAIGLPGINTGYRVTERGETITNPDGTEYQRAIARELHAALQPLDTAGREITIIFDYRAGDYSQSKEFKAACTTAKLFRSAIVKIAQLPGPDKGIDDFLVAGGDIEAVLAEAQDIKKLQAENLWRSYRRFTPDRIINQHRFEMEAPQKGAITAAKSGLGSGKTKQVEEKIASDPIGTQINLTHRNSLGLQLAEKLGSNHLDSHDGYKFFLDPNARLTLCIDSLLKIPIERLEGCTLIIDESASVIKHLLCSRTLLKNRSEILERFELACKVADRVVLMDGNQADWVVNYIATLAGNKAVLKIENQFKGDTPPVTFLIPPLGPDLYGNMVRKYHEFFEAYAQQILNSGCPAVATDSLQEAEGLAKRLTEELGDGILLTSKTVTEDWAKELLKNPDAYFEAHQVAWLIYTPTAESGVDISIKRYFSDVFCWLVGVLGVDESMQMSRRVRNPIGQIYIYCAERGLPAEQDSGATYYKQIAENIADRVSAEAITLTDAALTEATKAEIERQAQSPHFLTHCKIKAKENLERRDLRGYLFKAFAAAGYGPDMQDGDIQAGELQKIAKGEARDLACQQIFNAEDITFKEAEEIERKHSANWLDRCKAIKFRLLDRFPGLKDSELWDWEFVRRLLYEERQLRSQLEEAWLFENPEDSEYLQRRKWREPFQTFLPDHSDRWLKLRTMKGLGLEIFLEEGKAWSANSPEVQAIIKRCKKKAIANILGYPTLKYEMRYINKLLGLIGIKLVPEQVRGADGDRKWIYFYLPKAIIKMTAKGPKRICSLAENWEELSAFTASRMAQKVASLKEAEMLASKEFEFVTDTPINIIKKAVSVTNLEATPENPETPPEPIGRKARVRRWGDWVRGSFLAATDGAQLRMLIEQVGGWGETLAWPSDIRWEEA